MVFVLVIKQQEIAYIVVSLGKVLLLGDQFEPLTADQFHRLDVECLQFLPLVSGPQYKVALVANPVGHYQWSNVRQLIGQISDEVFRPLSEAVQLECWYRDHQYCGRCGNPTELSQNLPGEAPGITPPNPDRSRVCQSCGFAVYPRISPCVIGLVSRGRDFLLARGPRHPEGLFSTLAGFIEPGENAEQAFAREVKEEVGLNVGSIRYVESQAWPFPSQLMLGFEAQYESGELCLQENEIVEARWFNETSLPTIPPQSTLSGRLIRRFLAKGHA